MVLVKGGYPCGGTICRANNFPDAINFMRSETCTAPALRHHHREQPGCLHRIDQIVVEAACSLHLQGAPANLGYEFLRGGVEAFRSNGFSSLIGRNLNG